MKRKLLYTITFIIILSGFLTYLYIRNNNEKNDYIRVDVFIAENFKKKELTPALSLTDRKIVDEISGIVKRADKMDGMLNVASPKYILEFHRDNNDIEAVNLWINKDSPQAMIAYRNETITGYTIYEKDALKLKQILNER